MSGPELPQRQVSLSRLRAYLAQARTSAATEAPAGDDGPDLSGLFSAPQVFTDESSRYTDAAGRGYVVREIDGELTYVVHDSEVIASPLPGGES